MEVSPDEADGVFWFCLLFSSQMHHPTFQPVQPEKGQVQVRKGEAATQGPTEELHSDTGSKRAQPGWCWKPSSRNTELNWEWWHTPLVPAVWEAEAGASQVQVQPGKYSDLARPCYKNFKIEGLGIELSTKALGSISSNGNKQTKRNKKTENSWDWIPVHPQTSAECLPPVTHGTLSGPGEPGRSSVSQRAVPNPRSMPSEWASNLPRPPEGVKSLQKVRRSLRKVYA